MEIFWCSGITPHSELLDDNYKAYVSGNGQTQQQFPAIAADFDNEILYIPNIIYGKNMNYVVS